MYPAIPLSYSVLLLFTTLSAALLLHFYLWHGHRVTILSFRPLGVKYHILSTGTEASCFPVFVPHLPSWHAPYWLRIDLKQCELRSSQCHVTIESIVVHLWFFPVLLRHSTGSLASVLLEDFIVQVYNSRNTPAWLDALRRNLITNVLHGEYLRLDYIKKEIKGLFRPVSPEDDMKLDFKARQWQIRNWRGRIYDFGKIDAQWCTDSLIDPSNSTLVIIGKDCSWIVVKSPSQMESYAKASTVRRVLTSIAYFPLQVLGLLHSPMSLIDLFVNRIDVTFDHFRLRDAELTSQLGGLAKARIHTDSDYAQDNLFDASVDISLSTLLS